MIYVNQACIAMKTWSKYYLLIVTDRNNKMTALYCNSAVDYSYISYI